MRQLTVVQLLPALSSGGVERSTLEIAQALVRAGHRSVVVSAGGRLVPELLAEGSQHIELDIGRKSLLTLRHVQSLRSLFTRMQPDVVHARSRLPAWLAILALKSMDRRPPHLVTTVHGLNSSGFYSGVMCRGERVICVSDTVRAYVLAQWPDTDPSKLTVIERGIDAAVFSRESTSENDADHGALAEPRFQGQKLLLMPGRGTRLKGHAAAITLLAGLREAGVNVGLWLLGTREPGREAYIAELEAMAKSLDVAEFMQISPARADVVSAYRQADVVLQLSAKPEAFGRTVVEALSVGRPVVGWSHGGVGELLARYFPEGQVALGDQAALLATTLRLLSNERQPARIFPQTLAGMQAQTLKVYESITN
jgi:glycosyltransferase involved in cell wall biosynthesis